MSQTTDKIAQKPMNVIVSGKVTRVRRAPQGVLTTVVCPAKDEYSRPSFVEIRSKGRIGEVQDKITVVCTLGGYEGRSYNIVDRETGERRSVVPVIMYLEHLE